MLHTKKLYIFYIIFSLVLISGAFAVKGFFTNPALKSYSSKDLLIHFLDVGQGDAALIQINNKNILLDGGPKSNSSQLINYLKSNGVKTLDYIIATHPHEDHIGSLSKVIRRFKVSKFYAPKVTSNSDTFKDMAAALQSKNLKITPAKRGTLLDLGIGISAEILSPSEDYYEDINNYSIVLKLSYGSNSFLFMGDAEKLVEDAIIKQNSYLQCDVLKVGHHGSNSSSSANFLDKVSPKFAIISSGKGNPYNHPHQETLRELSKRGVEVHRTDTEGTILMLSSDSNIKIISP